MMWLLEIQPQRSGKVVAFTVTDNGQQNYVIRHTQE